MKYSKRAKLEKAGFKVGGVKEFLDLSDDEVALIDLKIRLIEKLKSTRKTGGVRQSDLAALISSSQSRIAKIETAAPDVSLDLICRALFALGVSREDIGKTLAAKRAA
jgi:hypothetical protein